MPDLQEMILAAVAKKNYRPVKPKALARKLGVSDSLYPDFRQTLRDLAKKGRVVMGKDHTIKPANGGAAITGTFHKTSSGTGYVRPHAIDGHVGPEIRVRADDSLDAATGDTVLVR